MYKRNDAFDTETAFSDTRVVDSGDKAAKIFIGWTSIFADVYCVKTDKELVITREDNICEWGKIGKLIRDSASAEIRKRIKDILRELVISACISEPYHKNQNFFLNPVWQ